MAPQRSFLGALIVSAVVSPVYAQQAALATSAPAPLGLPRLKSNPAKALEELAPTRFAVDDLKSTPAGVVAARRGSDDYLAAGAGREWSRPLRGAARDVTFVSVLIYGSVGTTIEAAGALIAVANAPTKGHAQLLVGAAAPGGIAWRELGYLVPLEPFGGEPLAELPVLTLRLDPAAGDWDLFAHGRVVATGLPLVAANSTRQILVRGGEHGAWICGMVNADDNPLFEDANANGIDDAFERRTRGALLAANAPATERKALADQAKEQDRRRQPIVWSVRRPTPDKFLPIAEATGRQ